MTDLSHPLYWVLLIIIRPLDSSIKVQFSINASFELEPTLGNGETLCCSEISVGDLAQAGGTYRKYGKLSALVVLTKNWRSYILFGKQERCRSPSFSPSHDRRTAVRLSH